MSNSLDAKIVVLGSQGVGKTSLVIRYVKNIFSLAKIPSTIGASFVTKRVVDTDSNTTVRLQIWDTAGQERFRSISKLYYRGANAGVLCYDITDEQSFEEMGKWLIELRKNMSSDIIFHVVGTKADLVHADPSLRAVPFERCIAFVAQQLAGESSQPNSAVPTPARRNSGFWGQEAGWDTCHEISALDDEGVEEVFRVITRKLIEQRNKQDEAAAAVLAEASRPERLSGASDSDGGRVSLGEHRRSWLRFPPGPVLIDEDRPAAEENPKPASKCC